MRRSVKTFFLLAALLGSNVRIIRPSTCSCSNVDPSKILSTFLALTAIDAPSKSEGAVATYCMTRLQALGLNPYQDQKGNVIGYLPGQGEPILLNAHMDRVPPGKGNIPVITGDSITSDGTTNLGADDTAGLTIILESIAEIVGQNIAHPPLVIAFTVEEEIGLLGARALDLSQHPVQKGIVIDNGYEAGVVISQASAYVAIDLTIKGKAAHPAKDLTEGINAIEIFRRAKFPIGEADNGKTRINVGTLNAGTARNAVPDKLIAQCEIRSFLEGSSLDKTVHKFQNFFTLAAASLGGSVNFTTTQLATAYKVDPDEPLLQAYKSVVEQQCRKFVMKPTFVASDTNVLRGERGLKVFTISTGDVNEHSLKETIKLSDMVLVTNDLVCLLKLLAA